ncbi:MAG: tyrosine--tRNA ligase [Rickettsiales bacterium]|jgi:tyrosyl-tRNA synthetase|nr:tyrosine--tRNA ligase [Rickettsiales bacterium]
MTKFKSDFLNEISERGMLYQCTDIAGLDARLSNGKPVSAYWGTDPTADALHVGHLASFSILRIFARHGGKVVILVGGATGMIGDNDKLTERPPMDEATLAKNIAGIGRDLARFFDFKKGAMLVNNYDWFKNIKYMEFLRDVGRHFTINEMLSKDSVKVRLEKGLPMTYREFSYSLFQAYDFVHLNREHGVDVQLFGSDQWGNAIAGVNLGRKLGLQLFGLSNPLVLDSAGKKLGKSEGNAVWLDPSRTSDFDYYQYFRNVADADVVNMLKIFTDLPLDEIERLGKLKDAEINEAKKVLAFEATKICRGAPAAMAAAETAGSLFSGGADVDAVKSVEIKMPGAMNVVDFAIAIGMFPSKGEARRTIEQGGLAIDGKKVSGADFMVQPSNEMLVQKGKKTFLKAIVI